jgi:cell pole-organizing protein PopZ
MTSSTAQPRPSLSEDRQTNEPSMEEILASIRRLIAEDEAELGAASLASEERRPAPGRSARAWVAASAAKEPSAVASVAEVQHAEVHARSAGQEEGARPPSELESEGYAPTAQAEAAEALGAGDAESQLAISDESLLAEESMEHSEDFVAREPLEADPFTDAETPAHASALVSADAAASITAQFQSLAASRVLNDSGLLHEYAREMLRPMLKAWLDDNLPGLVERLVRAEIERVARGGRR